MTGIDDLEALAAEYVVGTLDIDERRAAVERLAVDPAFRAMVAAWEKRLQPLADAAKPLPPNTHLFDGILSRIATTSPAAAAGGNVVALRRSITRWRIGAAVAAAAAAVLLAVVVIDRTQTPQTEFVAMLTSDGKAPAFVVTVDTVKSTLSIRRVADAAPADKSYELWAVQPGADPKSLGVIEQATYTRPLPYQANELVLAVSLEQKGGSVSGKPGEVVFSGPLLKSQ